MALIDVAKESLVEVLKKERELNLCGVWDADKIADFILTYYTPVIQVSPLLSAPSAFAIRDVIAGELVHSFPFRLAEKDCKELQLRYFPTAQYKLVKLYEVVE